MRNTVITYGTFDLFHIGHLNMLTRARQLGDRLIVGVSTDSFNEIKGKRCIAPYAERAAIVNSLEIVDEVIPEECWAQKADDIIRFGVKTFVIGDDWKGKFDEFNTLCSVIYLERTPNISSSLRKIEIAEVRR